jgi:hypothetical protein
LLVAHPALADALEDENSFCVLLGLTLAGVLGGWAFLFRSKGPNHVSTDAAMAVLAVPALFVTVAVFFPAPERLVVVAPALPLIVAGALRAYLNSRARAQVRPVGQEGGG